VENSHLFRSVFGLLAPSYSIVRNGRQAAEGGLWPIAAEAAWLEAELKNLNSRSQKDHGAEAIILVPGIEHLHSRPLKIGEIPRYDCETVLQCYGRYPGISVTGGIRNMQSRTS